MSVKQRHADFMWKIGSAQPPEFYPSFLWIEPLPLRHYGVLPVLVFENLGRMKPKLV